MNTALFVSRHAVVASVLCVGFGIWLIAGHAPPGSREALNSTYLLTSGWAAFGLMVLVSLYSLRKYAHRMGVAPDVRLRVPTANLERAESRMNELRREIVRGAVREKRDAHDLAARIAREEGVHRVARPRVEEGGPEGPKFLVSLVSTEPMGRVVRWLHVHAYYGLAAGIIVWLHGGFSVGSPLGVMMNALTAFVVVSGIVGIFLWATGPSRLTRLEKDFSFEQAFVQDRSLAEKIGGLAKELDPVAAALHHEVDRSGPGGFDVAVAAALSAAAQLEAPVRNALRDLFVLQGQRRRIRRELDRLVRVKFTMNIWRAVHVPGTILLFGCVIAHIVLVWRY